MTVRDRRVGLFGFLAAMALVVGVLPQAASPAGGLVPVAYHLPSACLTDGPCPVVYQLHGFGGTLYLDYFVNDAVARQADDVNPQDPGRYLTDQAFEAIVLPMNAEMEIAFEQQEVQRDFSLNPGLHHCGAGASTWNASSWNSSTCSTSPATGSRCAGPAR